MEDTIYHPHKLEKIISKYLDSQLFHNGFALKIGTWRPDGLFPRDLIFKAGGWRDFNWGEELDFLIRVALTGRLKFVNAIIAHEHGDFHKDIHVGLIKDIILGETRYEHDPLKRMFRNLGQKLDFYFT
jgi:hypothetical protein